MMMTASESDALLAEPLPTSALSRCPEPYEEGMWDKPRSPHQRVPIPGRAGFLVHPSGRLYGPPCVFLVRKFPSP